MQTLDNFKLFENEEIRDNMIYCTICGEPKLLDKPKELIGENFYNLPTRVRIMCSCEQKNKNDKMEQLRKQMEFKRFKSLQSNSLLGKRYFNVNFENTDLINCDETFLNAFNRCKKYCENSIDCLYNGFGIYLYGDSGIGKTHLMACMINELTKKLNPCLITNLYEISKEIRKAFTNGKSESDFINSISEVPFLFIDDIGTERLIVNNQDTFIQEKLYDVINNRYLKKKPTIFSSNLNIQQLMDEKDMWKKTVDRIAEMSSAVIEIKGKSYRLKNRQKELPF